MKWVGSVAKKKSSDEREKGRELLSWVNEITPKKKKLSEEGIEEQRDEHIMFIES